MKTPTERILYALLIAFLGGVGLRAFASEPRRPNVLFLCVDDMKDWVGCLGGYEGKVHTPNIDRLARRGMLFRNAHCPSPKCAPSRAAIMTGLRPSTTGLYDNSHWWFPSLPGVATIPSHFRRHGYRVVGAGKVFHHTAGNHPPNQWDDFRPLRFREDPWFRSVTLNYPWSQPEPYPPGFPFSGVKGLGHENDWGSLPISDSRYDDALTEEYAVQFLRDEPSTPFFLACGFFRPHLPWYVPQRFFDRYRLEDIVLPKVAPDDLDDVPAPGRQLAKARRNDFKVIKSSGNYRQAVQAYLASITCVDERIGRVLDALQASPYSLNTIVVLWSDHGWHLGEKQHWHKSTLWEEATRVPLVIRVPGLEPGQCRRAVSLLDLFPTLSELAGLQSLAWDGESLVPLLRDPTAERERPAIIEYKRGNVAVRSERYRLIRYADGSEELYDHQSDPNEWTNLAKAAGSDSARRDLEQWIPKKWADGKPTKKAFRFDPDGFTFTHIESGRITDGRAEPENSGSE